MRKLWEEKPDYRRYNPKSKRDQRDFLNHPLDFLPYKRLYKNLTQEKLLELICDARRLHWPVLDLSDCGLDTLPKELGNMPDLRGLVLGNIWYAKMKTHGKDNSFTTLPDSIGKLSNLQTLDLYRTPITALPDSIGKLSNLQTLDLYRTPITALPDSIGNFSNLQTLNLSITSITALPDSIGRLKNLKTLRLCDLHLSSIPYSIVRLGLPFVTNDRFAKNCVNLTDVTLDEGDITLFDQPREVIEAYYQNRIKDAVRECKVIFLGDGGAGKSSLIERIENDTFQENAFHATDGIKMTKWEATIGDKPVTIRFLDFGGQEIMHSMHRCFLTSHTVYVVVCESRDDTEIDRVATRWMETVKSFAPDCPVILALNKSDMNANVTVDDKELKERNENYIGQFIRTSAKEDNDPGVKELVAAILREVPGCLSRLDGNEGMLKLKRKLEDMEKNYLTPEEYKAYCAECGVEGNLQSAVLGWFRDLGVAYSYDAENLRDVYVLNPAWLTNGIYHLILRTPERGFLPHRTIRETMNKPHRDDIIQNLKYTEQETEFILNVMREFKISLEVKKGGRGTDGEEMIPAKMGKKKPSRYDDFPKAEALHIRWEGKYIPNNLIHQLIILRYADLDVSCVWRTGGWFRQWRDGGCQALAEMDMDGRTLDLYVTGSNKSERLRYAQEFRETIKQIRDKLNTQVEEFFCYRHRLKEGKVKEDVLRDWFNRWYGEIILPGLDEPVRTNDVVRNTYGEEALKEWKKERGRKPVDLEEMIAKGQISKEDIFKLINAALRNG